MTNADDVIALKIEPLQSDDERVVIGCNSYGNPKLLLWADSERIEIGKYCSIADSVCIFGGGEHRLDWVTTYPLRIAFGLDGAEQDGHPSSKGPTIIGNDVWIGYGAKVLSGVTVGDGAVIAAGSVVVKDVEPYSITAGNPAKMVRYRFKKNEIKSLLEIQWWNWPSNKIVEAVECLSSNKIDVFIRYATENTGGYVGKLSPLRGIRIGLSGAIKKMVSKRKTLKSTQ